MPSSQILRTRLFTLLCASFAVAAGVFYLHSVAAPVRYIAMNLGALLLGCILLLVVPVCRGHVAGIVCLCIGALLNATALFDESMHGVRRWLVIGGLSFEPALIFLPFGVMLFALDDSPLSALGMILTACAASIQPDRSMAGTLAFSLLTLLIFERRRWTIAPCLVALAAFAVTLFRADTVPPVPFVEGVFLSASSVSVLAGLAVVSGALVLLLPAFFWLRSPSMKNPTPWIFAAIWAGLLLASVLGNYPTPIVGYGSSSILGYLLSAACLASDDAAHLARSNS